MPGSGQSLFGRRCRLVISTSVESEIARTSSTSTVERTTDSIEILGGDNGQRIQFSVKKTLKKEPNTSEIRVTNLSPTTRASLQKKGVRALLEAGYKDTGMSRLFSGDVRTVDHVREGADWTTVVQLGDGERGWQFGRVSESFSAGTQITDIIRRIALQMGLDDSTIGQQVNSARSSTNSRIPEALDHGWAASGSASRALDHIMKAANLSWSVQDGQLQILAKGQALSLSIPDITPQSGLIGSPEMGTPQKKGKPSLLKFDALLTPVRPGCKVKLKSERYDGYVRIVGVEFSGDTHGGDWYSKMAGEVLR